MESTQRKLLARIACSSAGIFVGLVFAMTAYACPDPTTVPMVQSKADAAADEEIQMLQEIAEMNGAYAEYVTAYSAAGAYHNDDYMLCQRTQEDAVTDEMNAGVLDFTNAENASNDGSDWEDAGRFFYAAGTANTELTPPNLCNAYDDFLGAYISFNNAWWSFNTASNKYVAAKNHYSDALSMMEEDCVGEEGGGGSSSSSSSS